MTTLAADVRDFRRYLRAERGQADNTVLAYGRDLDHFRRFAEEGGLADHLKPALGELTRYIGFLREAGFHQMEEIELVDEDVRFSLPSELTVQIQ